jgi:L-methionine (R)-S-oxide reductase
MDSATDIDEICQELDRLEQDGQPFGRMLTEAVRRPHESSSRFDWTGIYELYPDGILRLGPFAGAPTDHVFISVGKGVCGSAVAAGKNMNIPDVSKADHYLACSATTKSELVVLIRDEETIFAQIDIDSHQFDAFSDDMVRNVEKLAARLADAYSRRPGRAV